MVNRLDKLPWTRFFAEQWAIKLFQLPTVEGNVYMRLRVQMLLTREPLVNNLKILTHYAGCLVEEFEKALDVLIDMGHIIRLEDGRLWSLDVESELNDCQESLIKSSEKGANAAKARWKKSKDKNDHDANEIHEQCMSNAQAMHGQCMSNANNINNNSIYNKKPKPIGLVKKELDEDFAQNTDQVLEPCSEQSEISSQPITLSPAKATAVKDTAEERKRQLEREFHETFWPSYPHKVGKPKALTSFLRARSKGELSVIMEGLNRYVMSKPPDRQWLNPTTFLNQERWADQPAQISEKSYGSSHNNRSKPMGNSVTEHLQRFASQLNFGSSSRPSRDHISPQISLRKEADYWRNSGYTSSVSASAGCTFPTGNC
ncbi:hypothetical protein BAnh1_09740 [Bartonella australis AUST/NH1]|uniref:Phage related protein n=1 Tax=Bartonella australis (strain Aust/NH1) TaxID=1094489 RepID=M1PE11_BARAA|nr:hypothetical protein [Bartonella australis]AGF74846.1 hypothetical protein BAnh1_09740 [Bartonella australis AUST/NH1]